MDSFFFLSLLVIVVYYKHRHYFPPFFLRDCQPFHFFPVNSSPARSCALTVDVHIEKDRYGHRLVWMTAG
jgi:hypothetical protein